MNYRQIFKSTYLNIIFSLVSIFSLPFKRKNKKRKLLIVKLDAIGDYILFRNFIKFIKETKKYKDYKITFVGNASIKTICEWLDGNYIDKSVWVNKKRLFKNPFYLIRILLRIGLNYDTALQPTISRELLGDHLVKFSNAKNRLTYEGDNNNIRSKEKSRTDKWYSRLIHINEDVIFDFNKHREFFEAISGEKPSFIRPAIDITEARSVSWPSGVKMPEKYAVLFPGASEQKRRWAASNFSEIAKYIKQNLNLDILICGSKSDQINALEIINKADFSMTDATGKTNLKELVLLIAKASILITNDTSAAHIGPALNTPTIALSQFNHYGRFLPYPESDGSKNICITPDNYSNLSFNEKRLKFSGGSDVDINLIEASQVEKAIDLLRQNN
ncbi:MAG: glycosyltransferase family 9 protein [Bacillota bacterium]